MHKRIGRWKEIHYEPLPAQRSQRGRALTDQEYDRLFRIAGSRATWEMAYLFAMISVNTSAGPKEVFTLRLQDVDLAGRTIRMQPEGPKPVHRVRIIPLNDTAFAAIQRALELPKQRGSVLPEHYLFPFRVKGNSHSGTYDPTRHCTTCKGAWHELTERAGLKGLRPYDLRHTIITDMLQNPDISEETVKAIAGHVAKRNSTSALQQIEITATKPRPRCPRDSDLISRTIAATSNTNVRMKPEVT
jgi:integrase